MARTLSPFAKREVMQLNSDNACLDLLTISHADLAQPIRLVNNNEDVVSNGNTYTAFNFAVSMPPEDPEKEPSITLTVGNVDRAITDALMSISSPANVKVETVLSSDPDTVEILKENLILRVASYNALEVTATIMSDDILAQAFPKHQYTPTQFKSIL